MNYYELLNVLRVLLKINRVYIWMINEYTFLLLIYRQVMFQSGKLLFSQTSNFSWFTEPCNKFLFTTTNIAFFWIFQPNRLGCQSLYVLQICGLIPALEVVCSCKNLARDPGKWAKELQSQKGVGNIRLVIVNARYYGKTTRMQSLKIIQDKLVFILNKKKIFFSVVAFTQELEVPGFHAL